ncbi:MAG: sigma-70 family RNA polymerase sigma factor [Verrucomicrobiota bacterium]
MGAEQREGYGVECGGKTGHEGANGADNGANCAGGGQGNDLAYLDGGKDLELVERIRMRDSGALGELWGRYAGLLYSQALRVLNNAAEADDIVVEVFEEVWDRADGYHQERAKPVAWLLMLARRRAIDRLRERQSYQRAGERLQKEWMAIQRNGGNQVEDHLRLRDLRRILDGVMGRLPEGQRRAVWMAYYDGLTQKEISKCTSTSVGTIKSRMELGLRKMRDGLRENADWISGSWEGEFRGEYRAGGAERVGGVFSHNSDL